MDGYSSFPGKLIKRLKSSLLIFLIPNLVQVFAIKTKLTTHSLNTQIWNHNQIWNHSILLFMLWPIDRIYRFTYWSVHFFSYPFMFNPSISPVSLHKISSRQEILFNFNLILILHYFMIVFIWCWYIVSDLLV